MKVNPVCQVQVLRPVANSTVKIYYLVFDLSFIKRDSAYVCFSGTVLDEGQLFVYEHFTKPISTGYSSILDTVFGVSMAKPIEQVLSF
jgi:hypothetical protein